MFTYILDISLSYKDIISNNKIIIKEMGKKQVILSIDGATKTGWVVYKNGVITEHGTKAFKPKSRLLDYGNWLNRMIKKYKVTDIVAENVFREHSRTKDKAFWALANMQGVLVYVAESSNIPTTFVNPLQVKGYMIPSIKQHERTEDKQRMIRRVKSLGYQLANDKADDEADAIGILLTYLYNKNLPVTHPKDMKQ